MDPQFPQPTIVLLTSVVTPGSGETIVIGTDAQGLVWAWLTKHGFWSPFSDDHSRYPQLVAGVETPAPTPEEPVVEPAPATEDGVQTTVDEKIAEKQEAPQE